MNITISIKKGACKQACFISIFLIFVISVALNIFLLQSPTPVTLTEVAQKPEVVLYGCVSVSSYNSEVGQTDNTPFITASNTRVRPGVAAANFLPFGTKVRFPTYFGNMDFIIEDRMNTRYDEGHVDIWSPNKEKSLNFGRRNLPMVVIEKNS